MKIFLAGEGPTELGDWAHLPQYRQRPTIQGCLEVLLGKITESGWSIAGAIKWKDIRKYQARTPLAAETRNVAGAALAAKEAGGNALVFARDQDGDNNRQTAIETGIEEALSKFPAIGVAGGVAIRNIEGWVLACRGELRSESVRDTKATLLETHQIEHLEHKVACLHAADIESLPQDAASLHLWLGRVRALFSAH